MDSCPTRRSVAVAVSLISEGRTIGAGLPERPDRVVAIVSERFHPIELILGLKLLAHRHHRLLELLILQLGFCQLDLRASHDGFVDDLGSYEKRLVFSHQAEIIPLTDDGKLVPVVKNYDPFAGAVDDLLPFCGKRIVADGLMINSPKMRMFMLQFKKLAKNGKWSRATQFTKNWGNANPGKKANQWFHHDKRVKAEIARGGVLGVPGLKPPKQ